MVATLLTDPITIGLVTMVMVLGAPGATLPPVQLMVSEPAMATGAAGRQVAPNEFESEVTCTDGAAGDTVRTFRIDTAVAVEPPMTARKAARSLRRHEGALRERLCYRPATPLGGARPASSLRSSR